MTQKTLNYFILVYKFPSALLHIAEDAGSAYTKKTGRVLNIREIQKYAESLGANTYTLGGKAVMKVANYGDMPEHFMKWAEGVYLFDRNTGKLSVIKRPEPGMRGVYAAAEEGSIARYGYLYFEETKNENPATA